MFSFVLRFSRIYCGYGKISTGSTSNYILDPDLALDLVLEDGGQEINCTF